MQLLSDQDIVDIWERGFRLHPLDRAIAMLRPAFPEYTWEELTTLPIHRRDDLLLSLHENLFGPMIQGFVECSWCKERLEFTLPVKNALPAQEDGQSSDIYELDISEEGLRVIFRFPNSIDLALLSGCRDVQTARNTLANQCVIQAYRDGVLIDDAVLSPGAVDYLAERMESIPDAEINISLDCPACGQSWNALLDVSTFLWTKIAAQARRILRETSSLAKAYGWTEEVILSMSPFRRRFYLEMAS